jgi:hypothetical protein
LRPGIFPSTSGSAAADRTGRRVNRRDEAEVEPLQAGRRQQIGARFVEERDHLVDVRPSPNAMRAANRPMAAPANRDPFVTSSTVCAHDNSVKRPNGVHVCGDPAVTARPFGPKSKHGLSSVLKSCA